MQNSKFTLKNNHISPRVSLEPSVCVEEEMGAGESKLGTAFTPGNLGNLDLTKEIWEQLELDAINSIQVQTLLNLFPGISNNLCLNV